MKEQAMASNQDIEIARLYAQKMARRMLISKADRKAAIRFLSMAKNMKQIPTWTVEQFMEVWRWPDIDPVTGDKFKVIE